MRYTTLKITFTALIFCVSFYMLGQTLTLQECVELALEKNITIKQSELDIANAELDKSNAFGNFLPNINAQTSHSWNIGLNQNITTGLLENLTTQFSSLGVNMIFLYFGLFSHFALFSPLNTLLVSFMMFRMSLGISCDFILRFLSIVIDAQLILC